MINLINDLRFINTSEATTGQIIFGNEHLIIPCININLMPNNSINKAHSFINYSYLIFKHVTNIYLNYADIRLCIFNNFNKNIEREEYVIINNYKRTKSIDLQINSLSNSFAFYSTSLISESFFVPYDTPNYASNMNEQQVENFMTNKVLPNEILQMIGDNFYRITF